MTGGLSPTTNGSRRPDRSQSRFLCNSARKVSLVFFVIAFAALVIGGGFAEISTNGSPTSLETAIVRWTILGSVVIAIAAYVIGGRTRANQGGETRYALAGPARSRADRADLRQTDAMGRAGSKPRKPKRRLRKVPKYEEPNTIPLAGLTGSSEEVFGSRYGHSADHHQEKEPGRFGSFVLRVLGMKPKS